MPAEPVSPPILDPIPKELFVELVFNGTIENANMTFWIKENKQRSDIVRTDKAGDKIVEVTTVFDGSNMYIIDRLNNETCTKINWPGKDELSSSLEFLETIYNPYISDKYAATAYWDAGCRDDPYCDRLSVSEETYEGKEIYLLTVEGEVPSGNRTVRFWVDKKTSIPIKKEEFYPTIGNITTEYVKIEGRKLSEDVFKIPEGCLDLTPEIAIQKGKIGNITEQITPNEWITVILNGKPGDVNLLSISENTWLFSKAPWVVQRTTLEIKSNRELPETILVYDVSGFESSKIPDLAWAYYNETTHKLELVADQISDATKKTIRCSIPRFGIYLILDRKIFREYWGKDVTEVS